MGINSRTKKNPISGKSINITNILSKAGIFDKVCINNRDYKNLNHIIYFYFHKKNDYTTIYIKLRNNSNALDN